MIKCEKCNGTGVCHYCNGTLKPLKTLPDGTPNLAWNANNAVCVMCNTWPGPGKCRYCTGSGVMPPK